MVRAFRAVVSQERPLRTTSYVLVETVALLQHRVGLEAVRDFDAHVYPLMSVEWVSDELHRRGMRRLSRENRRRLSLQRCATEQGSQFADQIPPIVLDAGGYWKLPLSS